MMKKGNTTSSALAAHGHAVTRECLLKTKTETRLQHPFKETQTGAAAAVHRVKLPPVMRLLILIPTIPLPIQLPTNAPRKAVNMAHMEEGPGSCLTSGSILVNIFHFHLPLCVCQRMTYDQSLFIHVEKALSLSMK